MTQFFQEKLKLIHCAKCGLSFGLTADYQERRRQDHKGFMCPAGHSNVYNQETEEEKLRRENQRLLQRQAMKDDEIKKALSRVDTAKRKASAFKGVATKIKKRVGNGTCPCCNRTFQNLQNHMKNQHPQYHSEEVKICLVKEKN